MINKIILSGNVATDIELKQTKNNIVYCQFLLAVQRNYKNQNDEYVSDFIRCVIYGNYASHFHDRVMKGQHISLSGRLEVNSFERDNNKVYSFRVVVDTVDYYQNQLSNNMMNSSNFIQQLNNEDVPEFFDWLNEK